MATFHSSGMNLTTFQIKGGGATCWRLDIYEDGRMRKRYVIQ